MRGDIVAHLRQVPYFLEFNEESLLTLARSCRLRHFKAKEALFHEGDPGQILYIVLSGRVNISKVAASGDTVYIAQRGPGEMIGEMALLDGKPRSADAVTDTACELLMLDRSEFLRCLERSPKMALAIIVSLAARLREAVGQLEGYRSMDVMGRLSAFLLDIARTHGSADPEGGIRLTVKFSQQEIADRVGATRETVNRALARLKEMEAIRQHDGYLVIMQPNALERYAAI